MQISDFGLAVSVGVHGSNNIKLSGTLGYVAPEYLLDGNILSFALALGLWLWLVPISYGCIEQSNALQIS